MGRRAARIKVLQTLFAIDLGQMDPEQAVMDIAGDISPATEIDFIRQLVLGTRNAVRELDAIITEYAVGWRLERMAAVDRNVLRMALYEMLYCRKLPISIIINEAVELAKVFNGEKAGKFVNALLDGAYKNMKFDEHSGCINANSPGNEEA